MRKNKLFSLLFLFLIILVSCGQESREVIPLKDPSVFSKNLGVMSGDTLSLMFRRENDSINSEEITIGFPPEIRLGNSTVFKDSLKMKIDPLSTFYLDVEDGVLILLNELNPIGEDWYRLIVVSEKQSHSNSTKIVAQLLYQN